MLTRTGETVLFTSDEKRELCLSHSFFCLTLFILHSQNRFESASGSPWCLPCTDSVRDETAQATHGQFTQKKFRRQYMCGKKTSRAVKDMYPNMCQRDGKDSDGARTLGWQGCEGEQCGGNKSQNGHLGGKFKICIPSFKISVAFVPVIPLLGYYPKNIFKPKPRCGLLLLSSEW